MIQALLLATLQASQAEAPPSRTFAFVGVDVIPMDRERVLHDQTLVVQDGRITALGPEKEVAVPEGATLVESRGKFLMPGLADMHVHVWDANDFPLLLANGVTTIRNMFGSPMHVDWRKKIAAAELLGPAIYTAGPIIDGDPPVWPGSTVLVDPVRATEVVAEQKSAGYDFLKAYARLTLPCYDALVEAAAKQGMRVMGHVPSAVGLEHVIDCKQDSVEHLDGWAAAAQADDSPFAGKVTFQTEFEAWPHVDDRKVEALARRSAKAGVWNCPTLVVYQKWAIGDEVAEGLARPEMKYVAPFMRWYWKPENSYLSRMPREFVEATRASDKDRKRVTGILNKAGARILLGTDLGNPFVVAGFSLHEELANLVAAGLSPYESLRAGTSGAAEFMHASDEWGTLAAGRRADFAMLAKNPLEDVTNAKDPLGVMVRGRWLERSELLKSLEDLASHYAELEASPTTGPK